MIKNNEKSVETKIIIIDKINKGIDQSLEQSLYCEFGYTDCFSANKCENCAMVNYNRDCNNNQIILIINKKTS